VTGQPYRIVDASNHGWLTSGAGTYRTDPNHPDRQNLTLDQVAEKFGPIRPVEPITDADEALLTGVFTRIGRKTITTLAAAIEVVFHELRESAGGLNGNDSYGYATRTMTAGRAGSWESAVLMEVMLFGNGLNLVQPKGRGPAGLAEHADWKRAAGPSKRVDVDGRRELADILRRWVTGPDRYVEVAETLAGVVSRYADQVAYGREDVRMADDPESIRGWKTVADQWLMPGGLAQQDFTTCYRLFYSLSAHFRSGLGGLI
jgi:hypothetical protein